MPGAAGGKRKKRVSLPTWDDPATIFARNVLDGTYYAGKPVKDACQRHMSDLEEGRFIWDPTLGDRFADFCRKMCRVVLPTRGGHVPFELLPWQQFCAYSILSWRVKQGDKTEIVPGARRYRYGFILTGKGSGKSPFGAAMGLYMMTADKYYPLVGAPVPESKPQCYVLASTIEQAEEVGIKHALDMVEGSPKLRRDMGIKPITAHPQRVVSTVRGSFLGAVGLQSKQGGAAGLNAHYLQWEEMHEQRDRDMLNDYVAGFKGRVQPLLLMVTNAGKSKQTIGYEEYQKALIAAGGHPNHQTYFSFVAECDEADLGTKWYPLEKHWEKANPSLGTTIRKDIIKDRIADARHEDDRQEVLRLYFSMWSEANDEFISQERWEAAEVQNFNDGDLEDGKLNGATLYIGLDAATKDDMCALALLWRCLDGKYRLRVKYFSPADGFDERAKQCSGHLTDWQKEGWITTPGGGMISMELIAAEIQKYANKWSARHVVSDSYRWQEMLEGFKRVGLPFWICENEDMSSTAPGSPGSVEIIQHPQIFMKRERPDGRDLWMEGSINAFKTLILGEDSKGPQIEIERNPVLRWNRASAVVAVDTMLNRRFDKKNTRARMHGKIDGLVASAMAVGLGVLETAKGTLASPWEDPNYDW